MARKGTYGSIQPARLDAAAKDLEVDYLVPIQKSEFAKDAEIASAVDRA